jgi:hypothetical protein
MTEAQWEQLYLKVHRQFQTLRHCAVLKTPELDRLETLRLIVNAYGSGKRTQKLFKQMQEIVGDE